MQVPAHVLMDRLSKFGWRAYVGEGEGEAVATKWALEVSVNPPLTRRWSASPLCLVAPARLALNQNYYRLFYYILNCLNRSSQCSGDFAQSRDGVLGPPYCKLNDVTD